VKDKVSFAMISAATYFWFQKLSCLLPWMVLARCMSNLRFDLVIIVFYLLQLSVSFGDRINSCYTIETVEISI
jgi:hypothetical protein